MRQDARVPSPESFVADLHIHSKYSRACSRDLNLENLHWWAQRKGITLLGTGDFTHPAWYDHLREQLVPAEDGLHRLSDGAEREIRRRLPPSTHGPVRFLLSVEISTIYKRGDRTRKVHHLVYLPDLEAVARFNGKLGHGPGGLGGNLGSDGRPILGLDSRDLLEITLECSDRGFLVPAHIWTPWFSALGSKSGFDTIADCYADLAGHIHAVETGLSSDPEMNWRVSSLDGYQLVSNSDAHSPQALAREATLLGCQLDYDAVKRAIEGGEGLQGTVEFFPEEGKYHADGHRACDISWDPARTREAKGICPHCAKPLTVGVLHRVDELADRPVGHRPTGRPDVTHLVQLPEIVGEVTGVGARSRGVEGRVAALVAALGPELHILTTAEIDDITKAGGELLGEAIARLRRGDVRRTPGYDGEYGVIRLFDPGELRRGGEGALFDVPTPVVPRPRTASDRPSVPKPRPARAQPSRPPKDPPLAPEASPHEPWEPMLAGLEEVGTGLLDRLDAMQRVAASAPGGPQLIVAGPGTGKTRTLIHRIAYLCAELGVRPEHCLAITFTRRAAEELRYRLTELLGDAAGAVTVGTFHAVGLEILRDHAAAVGLRPDFRVAEESERISVYAQAAGLPRDADGHPTPESARAARRALDKPEQSTVDDEYRRLLRQRNRVDLDDLIALPVRLLTTDEALRERYQMRWRWVFVDEYQDVDPTQYALLRLLVPRNGNICAIGDPDQAIYSFRGADVSFFLSFSQDYTDARPVRLTRNYRSSAPILAAAVQAVAPTTLVRGRRLDPARVDPDAPQVGVFAAGGAAAEAQWLARTVEELVGGVSHGSFDSGRVDSRAASGSGYSFADIAVLYRTDRQSGPVVEALTRAGIPVQKRSHHRIIDRRGVAELARELRYSASPASTGDLVDRVRAAGRALATGAPRLFDGAGPAADDFDAAPVDIYAAVELVVPLAARCNNDLDALLQALATGAEVDALDPRAQAVTLLTLHAAKGLEWPVVFIVGCDDGVLPLRHGAAIEEAAVAEERRLFFVGLTRAQERVLLSHAGARTPFLDAVDPGLLEVLGAEPERRRPAHRQLRLI
jgi:uncharacterized protein (TIGR00375 family)